MKYTGVGAARERDQERDRRQHAALAVPSSLVMMRPVRSSAASKACTWASAFCPVLPSITSSTSCGAPGSALAIVRRIFFSSSIRCDCVARRPAVSAMTTSQPRARPATTASKVTPAGSPPSWLTISIRLPAALSLSRRAAASGLGPLGPGEQLLARGGAKGVGRGEQHLLIRIDQMPGQLADAGGLAGAVDADHHDHGRHMLADRERPLQGRQQIGDAIGEQPAHGGRILQMGALDAPLQLVEQVTGRGDAGVGLEQRRLQVFVHRVVDAGGDERLRCSSRSCAGRFAAWPASRCGLRARARRVPRSGASSAAVVASAALPAGSRATLVAAPAAATIAAAAPALAAPAAATPALALRRASCRRTARRRRH
jgi:hypothetical protein